MLRLLEVALFAVPVILYAIWRFSAAEGGPPPRVIVLVGIAVLALATFLFWFAGEGEMAPSAIYVPPQMRDGQLIPGHADPP